MQLSGLKKCIKGVTVVQATLFNIGLNEKEKTELCDILKSIGILRR